MNTALNSKGPIIFGTLILLVPMLWMAFVGQDLIDMLLDAGMSRRYVELLSTGTIALGMLGVLAVVPGLMFLLQRRPALFWALAFFACTFSEARFPAGLDIVLLALRYACLMCMLSFATYLAIAHARRLAQLHIAGLAVFAWILVDITLNGGSSSVTYGLAYFEMFFAVPVIISICGEDRGYRESLLRGLLWAAPVCLLVNLSSLVAGLRIFVEGRFISYYPLPTNFANNFIMTVAVLWVASVWSKSMSTRLAHAVMFLVACGLIFLSGTRNSMLCVAFMVVVSGLMAGGSGAAVAAIIIMVLTLIGWVGISTEMIPSYLLGRLSVSSGETRVSVWQSALDLIGKSQWTGYGPDLSKVTFFDLNSDQVTAMNPHNNYLGIALRFGVIGLSLYGLYLAVALGWATRLIVRVRRLSPRDRELLALGILWMAVLCLAGLFEDNLTGRGTQQQLSFGLAAGLLVLFSRLTKRDS